ncbi:2OG-Fe(II) oxygenase [Sorangium sp. So ce1014]|uniref:2OG-Fe(II) oxygenase n=1 Tax=unclassified Sorangium TaxID=2621164 RepID=UPI003F5EF121
MKIQETTVNGRKVILVDHLFRKKKIEQVYRTLSESYVYYRGQLSSSADHFPKMVAHFVDLEAFQMLFFYEEVFGLMKRCYADVPLHLYKAYVNQTCYGDVNYPHVDCKPRRRDMTVLYYANPRWDREWGGETMLYDDSGAFNLAVLPAPGRVLIFPGATWHCAGIPSRVCPVSRFTLAMKYTLSAKDAREYRSIRPRDA